MTEEFRPLEPEKHITTFKGKEPGEFITLNEVNSVVTVQMFTAMGGHVTVTIPWKQNQGCTVSYITAYGVKGSIIHPPEDQSLTPREIFPEF